MDAAAAPTWSQVYTDIVSPKCIVCHTQLADGGGGGGVRFGPLDMGTVDAGYMNLINVPAMGTSSPVTGFTDAAVCDTLAEAGVNGGIRVVPGDAGASLICNKVKGWTVTPPAAFCGAPMPASGPIDDAGGQAAAFAEIKSWINGGAKP